MEIRDICITGIPNVHNFQHEFTNRIRARLGRDGYSVNNCYLNDNRKQFTKAFVRLKDPKLHEQVIDYYSRVGFALEVENKSYQLEFGWGSKKQDLAQMVKNLSEQLAQQAIIIQEQRVELEELRRERKDDDKKNNIISEAFLRNCSECNGVICSGCERELRLINTNGHILCAHCRSKNSRFPRLRAFLKAHAAK